MSDCIDEIIIETAAIIDEVEVDSGIPGPKGDKGDSGTDGTDASVTNGNVNAAIADNASATRGALGLGSGALVEADQNLRTTDTPTLAGLITGIISLTGEGTYPSYGINSYGGVVGLWANSGQVFGALNNGGQNHLVVHPNGAICFAKSSSTFWTGNSFEISRPAAGTIELKDGEGGMGNVRMGGLTATGPISIGSYTVATVPDEATNSGRWIEVVDEIGGPTLARSNGTNWLRVADQAIIS